MGDFSQERTQINESERVNLNEAKCTLLYVMNGQLARAEVIQSSQLMFSAQDLFKMSHKKSSRITECTTSDRENFLVSNAKCSKIFWLSILAQCAIFSGVSCKGRNKLPVKQRNSNEETVEMGVWKNSGNKSKWVLKKKKAKQDSFSNCLNRLRVEMNRVSQVQFQTRSRRRHRLHAEFPQVGLKMLKW